MDYHYEESLKNEENTKKLHNTRSKRNVKVKQRNQKWINNLWPWIVVLMSRCDDDGETNANFAVLENTFSLLSRVNHLNEKKKHGTQWDE